MSDETQTVEGEQCQDCGAPYPTVYRLPAPIWERIAPQPNGGGLLCPDCADGRARDQGLTLFWEAAVDEYPSLMATTERRTLPEWGTWIPPFEPLYDAPGYLWTPRFAIFPPAPEGGWGTPPRATRRAVLASNLRVAMYRFRRSLALWIDPNLEPLDEDEEDR